MSRLREPSVAGPIPARSFGAGKVLVAGPTGRIAVLTAAEHTAFAAALEMNDPLRLRLTALGIFADTADFLALVRAKMESGLLSWTGPSTHVVLISAGGKAMLPEIAKAVVDFVFSTPSPNLVIEVVDEDGGGWSAAWFAIAYARRRAEWSGRGLALTYRTTTAPPPDHSEFLRGYDVTVRAALFAGDGPQAHMFNAARARVVVGAAASDPESWVDALVSAGISGVEWVPSGAAVSRLSAARRYASFAARALSHLIDAHEGSNLRDELLVGLMKARPWDVPGTDLFETLAYAPDGSVFSSEEGWALNVDDSDETFRLGHSTNLRFQDLPSVPLVPALAAALAREAQPLCAACVYSSYCGIPPSAHFRAQGTLYGRLPDSPRCVVHMALLDVIFSRLADEKCLKVLEKWGIDVTRLTC